MRETHVATRQPLNGIAGRPARWRLRAVHPRHRVAFNTALASRLAVAAWSLNNGRCAAMSSARQSLGPSAGPIPSEPATARMSTAPSLESRVSPLASSTCCAPSTPFLGILLQEIKEFATAQEGKRHHNDLREISI